MSARAAPGTSGIVAFLEYYEKVRGRTSRVVDRIPAERLDWTWREGKFTLGDQVRHIAAIERYMYAENVKGKPSRYPGHGRELADGLPAVRAFFDRTHSESLEIFRTLTDADLAGKSVTPAGTPITTSKWLRAMVEHEIHHRGQIYLYLSMLDVKTPPIYGMTSEEVRARSVR
ncbi:MAG: DinB family protein [Acidobacteriota bacterium]|nr:DinB family protein [Acidobacteriota bacterium]MDQ2978155.1 DinB family protein [Acidobacteriota bacterium]